MKDQLLIARVEVEGKAARILNPGFILHQVEHTHEILLPLRIFLLLIQQIPRAFRLWIERPRCGGIPLNRTNPLRWGCDGDVGLRDQA